MLDEIIRMAAESLELTSAQVNEARQALREELASADARAAAKDAQWHPEGSTTRLVDAVPRSQQAYADQRKKAVQVIPKLLATLLAAEVARERRDEAERMLDLSWKAHRVGGTGNAPAELVEFYERLDRHGVRKSYFGEFSKETVAIIADLIAWKARDRCFRDADNPWRAVLGIYAERVIVEPRGKFKGQRSVSGTPTPPRHVSSDRHYMFNDMFRELPPAVVNEPAPITMPMIDCSTYEATGSSARPETNTKPDSEVLVVNGGEKAFEPTPLTLDRAKAVAEMIFDADAIKMGIYWPKDIEQGDYDPSSLIPALERKVASANTWTGAEQFLEAARRGEAREFIERKRSEGVASLAARLLRGDQSALDDMHRASLAIDRRAFPG